METEKIYGKSGLQEGEHSSTLPKPPHHPPSPTPTSPLTMTWPFFFFAVQFLPEFLHWTPINQMPATDYQAREQMTKTVNCSEVHEMCIMLCANNFTSQFFGLISLSQFVKDTKASTTSPLCSRKLRSAAALGISISSTWWSK